MPRSDTVPETVEAEVCIIGSGPAGLSTARELVAAGRTVVMLEAGTPASRPTDDVLGATICRTAGDLDLRTTRASGLGGTTTNWNTVRDGAAGAKYLPLDPLDVAPRPWLDIEGWPLAYETLRPWYATAMQLLRLESMVDEADPATLGTHTMLQFPRASLRSASYRWGSLSGLTAALLEPLLVAPSVRVLTGTRAAELVLNAGGDRVTAVRCIRDGASDCVVHAAEVVLAAGAIENARLLMQLARPLSPMLGIGFMEHPMDRSLQLRSRDPAISPTPGFYHFAREGVHRHLIGRIGLTAELQAAEQLVNANVRIFPMPVSRMTSARRALAGVLGRIPTTPYRVTLDLEQLPARDNRIYLTESRDMHGLRAVELAWSWSGADAARHERVVTVLTRELGHAGVTVHRGAPVLDPNAHHHAGLTRMHAQPDGGVVNADLCVHDVANLHVSGASVFPTAGVANPTLTIIALGLRLGAHLAHH